MKLYQIINAQPVLDEISKNKNLPTRTAYQIYVLLSKLETSIQFFENQRMELFRKYGVSDGDNLVIPDENYESFKKEIDELGNLDCEEEIAKIDIGLDVDLGVSPSEISVLIPFFNFLD